MLRDAVRPNGEKVAKRNLALVLSGVRQILGGGRSANLYLHLREAIEGLQFSAPPRLLDYGCGSMELGTRLLKEGVIGSYLGVDTFAVTPQLVGVLAEGCTYQQVTDLSQVQSLGEFDLVMLIDVLHHIPVEQHLELLRSLTMVSPNLLLKDHFEEGIISRNLLRLADWFGNYAYGVSIPSRYFSARTWENLIESMEIYERTRKTPLKIHEGIFGKILPSKYHFISVLESRSSANLNRRSRF